MNAGASGGETRDRLIEASAIDRRGKRHTLTNAEMGFTYRHAAAPDDLIFTDALFQGTPADSAAIKAEMDAVEHHREPPSRSARRPAARPSPTRPARKRGSSSTPPAAAASTSAAPWSRRCTAIS